MTLPLPNWPPRFDPTSGVVIRQPQARQPGYWVGAPGVFYEATTKAYFLSYRVRRPRGVLPDRGAETCLARSEDGIAFETIWTGSKEQLGSASIERCAVRRLESGDWALYISYVDPADGRWRVDLVLSSAPERFDLADARPLFTAESLQVEGVKDPYIWKADGDYQMILSYATSATPSSADELHGTSDAYNTGRIRSATALATSTDGLAWQWRGEILGPADEGSSPDPSGKAWDGYCVRIGCLLHHADQWIALYDGSADVSENYEERVGLAVGPELTALERVTPDGPWLTTPQGSGALRYFDAVPRGKDTLLYYEMAQPSGEHDLRVVCIG